MADEQTATMAPLPVDIASVDARSQSGFYNLRLGFKAIPVDAVNEQSLAQTGYHTEAAIVESSLVAKYSSVRNYVKQWLKKEIGVSILSNAHDAGLRGRNGHRIATIKELKSVLRVADSVSEIAWPAYRAVVDDFNQDTHWQQALADRFRHLHNWEYTDEEELDSDAHLKQGQGSRRYCNIAKMATREHINYRTTINHTLKTRWRLSFPVRRSKDDICADYKITGSRRKPRDLKMVEFEGKRIDINDLVETKVPVQAIMVEEESPSVLSSPVARLVSPSPGNQSNAQQQMMMAAFSMMAAAMSGANDSSTGNHFLDMMKGMMKQEPSTPLRDEMPDEESDEDASATATPYQTPPKKKSKASSQISEIQAQLASVVATTGELKKAQEEKGQVDRLVAAKAHALEVLKKSDSDKKKSKKKAAKRKQNERKVPERKPDESTVRKPDGDETETDEEEDVRPKVLTFKAGAKRLKLSKPTPVQAKKRSEFYKKLKQHLDGKDDETSVASNDSSVTIDPAVTPKKTTVDDPKASPTDTPASPPKNLSPPPKKTPAPSPRKAEELAKLEAERKEKELKEAAKHVWDCDHENYSPEAYDELIPSFFTETGEYKGHPCALCKLPMFGSDKLVKEHGDKACLVKSSATAKTCKGKNRRDSECNDHIVCHSCYMEKHLASIQDMQKGVGTRKAKRKCCK